MKCGSEANMKRALLIELTEIFRVTASGTCHPRVEQRNRQRPSALFIAIRLAFYAAAIVTETCFCLNVRSSVNLHSSSTPKMILCLHRKQLTASITEGYFLSWAKLHIIHDQLFPFQNNKGIYCDMNHSS